jgi:hypothetical protein
MDVVRLPFRGVRGDAVAGGGGRAGAHGVLPGCTTNLRGIEEGTPPQFWMFTGGAFLPRRRCQGKQFLRRAGSGRLPPQPPPVESN